MSAGNCPRCEGDGVHPSKVNPAWSVWCGLCNHTGNYPPTETTFARLRARLRRFVRLILGHPVPPRYESLDDALDRVGAL